MSDLHTFEVEKLKQIEAAALIRNQQELAAAAQSGIQPDANKVPA
jgi:hypothetical protein